ncbi:MAG: ABC transporter ATP-binding protein [Planctomycetes bacterium]|nr:ABC transporter ATP-binding protein [Planctomycetota bacterium]
MIEVENLTRAFGRRVALHGISFAVPRGEVAGFLGPNGAGKSTTLRILTTFLAVGGGGARVAGFDVARTPREVCRRVGYLPENVPLYPEMRVEEYLRFRAAMKLIPRRDVRERIDSALAACDLAAVRRQQLGTLSRGFRQRVGLADVLMHEPEVLILDEPTAGLDPLQVIEVRKIIGSMRGRRTVLFSSHILGEVEQVCDRVIIIHQGRIRADESRENWQRRLAALAALRVQFAGDPPGAAGALRAIPGMTSVAREHDAYLLRATRDVRLDVSSLAAKNGWPLLELHPRTAALEDFFLEVTREGRESA